MINFEVARLMFFRSEALAFCGAWAKLPGSFPLNAQVNKELADRVNDSSYHHIAFALELMATTGLSAYSRRSPIANFCFS